MRFVYADPSLVDNVGHSNATCRLVTRELRQRGIVPQVFAYMTVIPALRSELEAIPHFRAHTFAAPDADPIYGWLKTFHTRSETTLQDLQRLPALDRGDLVYFNSAEPPQFMAVILWLMTLPPERCPQVVVQFGHDPGLDISITAQGRYACSTRDPRLDARAPFYRFAGSKISPQVQNHLRMVTFERQTSAIYSSLIQHHVGLLPLPTRAVNPLRLRPGKAPLTVAVIGHQRAIKGYDLMPEITQRLLAERGQIRILVHNGAPEHMADTQRAMRALAARDRRIVLDERMAGPAEWALILDAADIVLCPYAPDQYRGSYSAIAVDAIANAIPIVGTAGTSMERLIEEWSGCGTVFGEFAVTSIVAATVQLIDNVDRYAAAAYAAAQKWPQRYGPSHLVGGIFACAKAPRIAMAAGDAVPAH